MNSNFGNQEQGHSAAEATAANRTPNQPEENRLNDPQVDSEARVADKRRFTPEGELIAAEENESAPEATLEDQSTALSEIEMLRARLKESEDKRGEAERQVRDFADRFRHAQAQLKAETDEQRLRLQRTFDQKLEAARGDLVAGLLDTLDNLKRAITAAEKSGKRESDFESLLEGVRATANMFEARMQTLGLSAVPSVGQEFNPEVHEAVESVPVPKDKDNQVIEELQTGYKFGDRLLRPARVRVGRAND
jgi:molecular chaperone GrpE